MERKRTQIILVAAIILVIGVIAATALFRHSEPQNRPAPQYQASSGVSYTNAITGETMQDIPAETGQVPGINLAAIATVAGMDNLGNYLTGIQTANVTTSISDFLLAHSGLDNVQAAIQRGTLIQSGRQLQFTLIVLQPQTTYRVTVHTTDQYQDAPDVTFTEVN